LAPIVFRTIRFMVPRDSESIMNQTAIESPCVKVCTLDTRAGLCLGCGRTLAEIAGWVRMSAEERKRIMAELPERLASRTPTLKLASG
jgi:predicted Fe-S protein YdhL (DUF1289 family)